MSDTSAIADLEGQHSPAEDSPQESDHEDISKYLVPNKEILTRNLEHMLVWLQGQPHGIQSRSPHSIITGKSSIQMKGKDGQTFIFQVDSRLDEAASEKIINAIQHGWNQCDNFSPSIGGDILHSSRKGYNRRVQTRFDKFEVYDFDLKPSQSKPEERDEKTGARLVQVACMHHDSIFGVPSFVVRPPYLPNTHSKYHSNRRNRDTDNTPLPL